MFLHKPLKDIRHVALQEHIQQLLGKQIVLTS